MFGKAKCKLLFGAQALSFMEHHEEYSCRLLMCKNSIWALKDPSWSLQCRHKWLKNVMFFMIEFI
jgi:hypothetical protein